MRRLQINFRNNRKILVVDGHTAYVGGHDVGNEYLGLDPKLGPRRDTQVMVRGLAVLTIQLAFLEDWHWATNRLPVLNWILPEARKELLGEVPILVPPSGPADEVETWSLFFLHVIHSARRRLWITSPYFVPDEAMVAVLQLAALRGWTCAHHATCQGGHSTGAIGELNLHSRSSAGRRAAFPIPGRFSAPKVVGDE
jgi:cardiolipin synthase